MYSISSWDIVKTLRKICIFFIIIIYQFILTLIWDCNCFILNISKFTLICWVLGAGWTIIKHSIFFTLSFFTFFSFEKYKFLNGEILFKLLITVYCDCPNQKCLFWLIFRREIEIKKKEKWNQNLILIQWILKYK